MSIIKNLFSKEPKDITLDDIENLIKIKKEEDRFLEYKSPEILNQPENFSKYISAFLNSEGGIIILGISEDDPKKKEKLEAKIYPQQIEFVDEKFTKERISQLIFSNIHSSATPSINIYPIRQAEKKGAIFLIEVLQGNNPPYQAADGKYYKKINATIYPLSHYEIADFLGRRKQPLLGLHIEILESGVENDTYIFIARFNLGNVGKAIAKKCCFTASFFNLEIVQTLVGNFQRIDNLREGIPTIQFDHPNAIYHPISRLTRIAEIKFKVKTKESPIKIKYDLIAEDMDYFQDEFNFNVETLEAFGKDKKTGMPLKMFFQTPHLVRGLLGID